MKSKTKTPNGKRSWTTEDEVYLMDQWGGTSIPGIAKKLGRTVNAIKIRASRLGLGAALAAGEYVTFNQLMVVLSGGRGHSYSYQVESWIEKRGFPARYKRVVNNRFRVVYLEEFWKWAKEHRSFIDFSRMEPLSLGKEPAWVEGQRKIDAISFANQRKDPWTQQEDQRLIYLLKQHKYSWSEMSHELRRSAGAIQRRCCDLGIKERPLRASPHNPWNDTDQQLLADMLRRGCSYTMIGDAVRRSEKAVRGVVYQRYGTENADKVRAMLGKGAWGAGAPERPRGGDGRE